MKRIVFISILGIFFSISLFGQQNVAINTTGAAPDASAILDVSSINKGLLIPRMTQSQRNAIVTPATALTIYQTDNNPGYYYYDGTQWIYLFNTDDQNIQGCGLSGTILTIGIENGTSQTVDLSSLGGSGADYDWEINGNNVYTAHGGLYPSGNVGIGTTNPTARLQVTGNAYITTYLGVGTAPNTANRVYAYHSSGNPSILGHNTFQTTNGLCGVAGTTASAGNGYLGTYLNGIRAGVYGEAGSYSSSINYAGYFDGKAVVTDSIGIGTDNPQSLVHIYSTNSYDGLRLERGPSWGYWVIGTAATNNLWFTYNGALTAWIDNTSGLWTTSDRRLKKDFSPIESCLEKVLALEALEYTFIKSENNRRDIGFISQDVEKLFPQLVQEQDGYFFMNYSLFSVIAIKAVQEQQTIIEKQQQEIDDLRKEIDEIKKIIDK